MAKTAKVKKREVTIHSRAARRAASPSINLDKSSKPANNTRDSTSPSRPEKINQHALAAKDAGIMKKQKKGNMTRAQRVRQQKQLERAADNMDKLEIKRIKSVGKGKTVKERAKGWEDVNDEGKKKGKAQNAFDALEEVPEKKPERAWGGDEEMDGNDISAPQGSMAVEGGGKSVDAVVAENGVVPTEEDELL